MIRFAADENFNHTITRGLLRRQPDLDIVRVQDVGLAGAKDEAVLEWAAREGRVLLTQDARTITKLAFERVRGVQPPERNGKGRFSTFHSGDPVDVVKMMVSAKARLRNELKEGYLRENDVNRRLSEEWFLLEEEAWQMAVEQDETRPNPLP